MSALRRRFDTAIETLRSSDFSHQFENLREFFSEREYADLFKKVESIQIKSTTISARKDEVSPESDLNDLVTEYDSHVIAVNNALLTLRSNTLIYSSINKSLIKLTASLTAIIEYYFLICVVFLLFSSFFSFQLC